MVFPTCSPTPSTTVIKVTVKCHFCYRNNETYIMSFGNSFCDDECQSWWRREEQKRLQQEYLQLQGMLHLLN